MDSSDEPSTHDERMIDRTLFEHLQAKIDEDNSVREELRNLLQSLEKQGIWGLVWAYLLILISEGRITQSILSRAHAIPLTQSTHPEV